MAISSSEFTTDSSGLELKQHGSAAFPAACYEKDLSESSVAWHWHEKFELTRVTKGEAEFLVNGKEILLKEGEGVFVNVGVLHAYRQKPGIMGKLQLIVVDASMLGGEGSSVYWTKYLTPLMQNATLEYVQFGKEEPWEIEAASLIRQAWQCCAAEPECFEWTFRENLSHLFGLLLQHCDAEDRSSIDNSRELRRIKSMLAFVQENYGEKLSLENIARAGKVSASECIRCFNNKIHMTPFEYLNDYRLLRAAEQIAGSNLRINTIAGSCGFNDMSYFSKLFRRKYELTPSEYRKAHRADKKG